MSIPPVPVTARIRAFPAIPPHAVGSYRPFPERVILIEHVRAPDGRTLCGAYLGEGPDLEQVTGRFLGPAATEGLLVPGTGPLRDSDTFLDRIIWRPVHESRFGLVAWDPAAFFAAHADGFKHGGTWAVIFTDLNPAGGRWIDYHRSPIIFKPKTDGRIDIVFGPRKDPQPRDLDNGRQDEGRIRALRDAASAFVGEPADDLATACRMFDIKPPPPGPGTLPHLPSRIAALRDLYRALRREAELWP